MALAVSSIFVSSVVTRKLGATGTLLGQQNDMWSNAFLSQARWNWTTFGTAEKLWDRVRQYLVSESERTWTAFQRIGKLQIGRRGRPTFFLGDPSAQGEFRTDTERARNRFLLEALRVLTIFGRAENISDRLRRASDCVL